MHLFHLTQFIVGCDIGVVMNYEKWAIVIATELKENKKVSTSWLCKDKCLFFKLYSFSLFLPTVAES